MIEILEVISFKITSIFILFGFIKPLMERICIQKYHHRGAKEKNYDQNNL